MAHFCGGEFSCVDDVKEGTHITAGGKAAGRGFDQAGRIQY